MEHDKLNQGLTSAESPSSMSVFDKEQTPIIGYLQHKSFAKLFLLNLFTFNAYRFYWFYENWDAIKTSEKRDILPFWRALFSWFYLYPLFKRIYVAAKEEGYAASISYSLLATLIVVLKLLIPIVTLRIGINFAKHAVDSTNIHTISKVIDNSLLSGMLLWTSLVCIEDLLFWPIQKAINFYNVKLTQAQQALLSNINSPATYFEAPPTRFVILSILTLPLYFIYWQYKNWQAIKRADKSHIWPFWRAVFSQFFIHALFKRITISAKSQGYNKPIPYLALAAVSVIYPLYISFILLLFLRFALLKLGFDFLGLVVVLYKPFVDLASDLARLLLGIPVNYYIFTLFQQAIHYYNAQVVPNYQPRKGFTRGEIILASLGISFYGLLLLVAYYLLK